MPASSYPTYDSLTLRRMWRDVEGAIWAPKEVHNTADALRKALAAGDTEEACRLAAKLDDLHNRP
ncbi:hypothetical protein ACJ6WD_09830 [Streptomyces sp. VTCC 41912]|uniref:hypothetical protein n=1 Tax=Streptomyces sp. VTCC 41912 TaxID=3383243 RepID=UPI003896CE23